MPLDKVHVAKYVEGHVYFDLLVCLMSESDGVPICIKIRLVDQSGNGIYKTTYNTVPCVIATRQKRGFPCYIDRDDLEESYLKDDCLKIECTLTVFLLPEITTSLSAIPCHDDGDGVDGDGDGDDVGVDVLTMLRSGECCDVVFIVGDEKFYVHKGLLSARSSFFESMFASRLVSDQREIVISDVDPHVFKALLHFIYSDTLPEKERSLMDGYSFGPSVTSSIGAKLLAAADKYDVKKLKSICISHLWRSISLSRFAEILSLAVKYNAPELEHLCFEYAVDNYDFLVELDSFIYLQKKCPLLLNEVNDYIFKERSKETSSSCVDDYLSTHSNTVIYYEML